jgi:hypothetical protein
MRSRKNTEGSLTGEFRMMALAILSPRVCQPLTCSLPYGRIPNLNNCIVNESFDVVSSCRVSRLTSDGRPDPVTPVWGSAHQRQLRRSTWMLGIFSQTGIFIRDRLKPGYRPRVLALFQQAFLSAQPYGLYKSPPRCKEFRYGN